MWGNKKLRLGYETDLNPQTKNPTNGGLDVDERNKYNHFVNVNCIQTS